MTVGVYKRQLTDASSDGTVIGQTAAELIAFHGATPVSQIAYVASLVTTAPVSVSGTGFAFTTSAQAIAITTAINAIQRALIDKGIMAAS